MTHITRSGIIYLLVALGIASFAVGVALYIVVRN